MDRAVTVGGLGRPIAATRRNRLALAGFGATALVFSGVGVVGLVRGALSGEVGVATGVGILMVGVAALIVAVVRKRSRDFVAIMEGGVYVDVGGQHRALSWSEITRVDAEVADLVSGMTRRAHDQYRVLLRDGTEFSFNWEFEQHREVGLCCQARFEASSERHADA